MDDPRSHKRFGTIATELGLLTPVQLSEALKRQVEDVLAGKPRRAIGQILREMGFLSVQQVAEVVLVQKTRTRATPASGLPGGDPAARWRLAPLPGRRRKASTSPAALEE